MEYIGISLQEYLIKHSKISKAFIREFIAIQESDVLREHYPFVVDLDLIVKWLQLSERKPLIKTLKNSYKKDTDYILLGPRSGQDNNHGGNNKKIIFTTILTFKKICLRTKSSMSNQIINYYLALEDLVIQYQKYIVSVLIEENKLLKNDLNNDIFPVGGLIYVLDMHNGYYKLGKTADLKTRKQIYDTGMVHKSKVLFWFEADNINILEGCVKNILKPVGIRKGKEVYNISLDKIINTIKGCDRLSQGIICNECKSQPGEEKTLFFLAGFEKVRFALFLHPLLPMVIFKNIITNTMIHY